MRKAVSSVCVRSLARELGERLSGARVDKAYQVGEKEIVLTFRKPGEGGIELVCAPNFVCITNYKRKAPTMPSSFAMQLRKELGGSKIVSIRQHEFDRIIEFDFERVGVARTLVVELFSKGNVILLGEGRKIIGLIEWQKWKDRKLGVRQTYEHPPSGTNPLALDKKTLKDLLSSSEKDVVRTLAVSAGLGGTYAEEACLLAQVDKNKSAQAISSLEAGALYASLKEIFDKLDAGPYTSQIVSRDGARIDAVSFPLTVYDGLEAEEFPSFNEAVDEYYSNLEKNVAEDAAEKRVADQVGKLRAIEAKQVDRLAKLKEDVGINKQAGDLLYARMQDVEGIVAAVKKAREKDLSDEEVTAEFASAAAKTPAAALVKEVKKTKLVLELE